MGNQILGANGIAIRQGIYAEKSTMETDLGRFIDFEDGRRFRYCQANGEIIKGHMCSSGTVVANDNTITQTAMTVALSNGYIGETVINVLLGAATTANLYAGGYLTIEGGTGLGQIYKIKSNKAGGALYTTPCEITLYDGLIVALDATSIISLTKNRYKDVVVTPATTLVGTPIGVPLITVTDNYYFWAQTRGYAAVVVDDDGSITVGNLVSGGGGDAGAIITCAADTAKAYGVCVQVAAIDTYATVDLKLE